MTEVDLSKDYKIFEVKDEDTSKYLIMDIETGLFEQLSHESIQDASEEAFRLWTLKNANNSGEQVKIEEDEFYNITNDGIYQIVRYGDDGKGNFNRVKLVPLKAKKLRAIHELAGKLEKRAWRH